MYDEDGVSEISGTYYAPRTDRRSRFLFLRAYSSSLRWTRLLTPVVLPVGTPPRSRHTALTRWYPVESSCATSWTEMTLALRLAEFRSHPSYLEVAGCDPVRTVQYATETSVARDDQIGILLDGSSSQDGTRTGTAMDADRRGTQRGCAGNHLALSCGSGQPHGTRTRVRAPTGRIDAIAARADSNSEATGSTTIGQLLRMSTKAFQQCLAEPCTPLGSCHGSAWHTRFAFHDQLRSEWMSLPCLVRAATSMVM